MKSDAPEGRRFMRRRRVGRWFGEERAETRMNGRRGLGRAPSAQRKRRRPTVTGALHTGGGGGEIDELGRREWEVGWEETAERRKRREATVRQTEAEGGSKIEETGKREERGKGEKEEKEEEKQ